MGMLTREQSTTWASGQTSDAATQMCLSQQRISCKTGHQGSLKVPCALSCPRAPNQLKNVS